MYGTLRNAIIRHEAKFREEWPTSAAIYLPNGAVPEIGDRFRQPDWASALSQTVEAEDIALEGRSFPPDDALRAAWQ